MYCCPINFGWQVLTKCKLRAYGGDGNMHKRQVLTGVLVVGLVLFLACVAEEFWRKGNLYHGAVHRSHEVSAYQQHDCSQPTPDILTRSSRGRETKALTLVKTLMSGQHESQWKKRDYMQTSKGKRATEGGRCGRALLKGRRISQEDRIVCVPEIQLQFIGEEHSPQISLLAVFDGHDGHEASELAATSIYPLFLYHVHSIVGDLVSTLCLSDMDTCSQPPETRGQNWHHPVGPQHMHSAQVYDWFCGEGRKNGSSMLLVEQCLDIKAAAMEGLFGAADAVTFSDVAKTMWDATAKQASHKADSQSAKKWDGESLENVRNWMASGKMQGPFLRAILKEALAKAVLEIDAIFSNKARRDGLEGGSTACVVLLAEKHLLVANLGDCKALICSSASSCSPPLQQGDCQEDPRVCLRKQRRKKSSQRVRAEGDVQLCVKELTSDHRPDREDEKIRILAAGGFIENSGGVPRVNGRLAVTRSIGDIALKRFGVTAEPELSSWQSIADTDNFIVVASDGVFDKMTPQDVCNTISAVTSGSSMSSAAKNILQPEPAIPLLPRESLKSLEVDSEILAVPKFTVTVQEVKTVSVLPPSQEGKTALSFPKSESLRLDALDFKGMQSLALAESTELETVVEPRQDGVHQQMAQAVVDTALGLGSMDNLAAVVLPLRSLYCLNSEESSVSRGKREDRVMTIDKDKAPKTAQMNGIISPSSDVSAEHVSEKVSRSRQCYELIKALPRQSIIPMYPVPTTIGRVFKWEPQVITKPEAKHEGGLLQSIPAYKPDSEDAFCRALSGRGEYELDVYREHLVYAPGQSELGQHQEICLRPKGLSQYLSLIGSVPVDTLSLPASERESMSGRPAASSVLPPYMVHHHRYLLKRNIAKGAFGEIWLGVRRECLVGAEESGSFNLLHPEKACNHSSCNNNTEENYFGIWGDAMCLDKAETFIFKRILVEKGSRTFLSGYREKYFGELFLNSYRTLGKEQAQRAPDVNQQSDYQKWRDEGLGHVARYIEAFERSTGNELWLVFRNEGQSLSKLLYVADTSSTNTEAGHFRGFNVLKPSPWWHWLKTTDIGRKEMRNLLKQLLLAVHACHSRNITHRDIKPENMIVKSSSLAGGPLADWPTNLTMHLIDFGSAIDPFTLQNLYGRSGPTQDEQTLEYAPPEALLGRHWIHFHAHRAHVYDIWSVGVVMLELVLGTPHVFQISARTRALLDHRLKGWDQAAKETAYMLRAFMEMCILPPGIPPHRHHRHGDNPADQSEDARLVSFECSDAAFSEQIKQRDPLGIGMPDLSAMRLVRRLLEWYPDDRISALEALQDAYFHEAEDSTNGF